MNSEDVKLLNGIVIYPGTDWEVAARFTEEQSAKDRTTSLTCYVPEASPAPLYIVREHFGDTVFDAHGMVSNHPWTLARFAERRHQASTTANLDAGF